MEAIGHVGGIQEFPGAGRGWRALGLTLLDRPIEPTDIGTRAEGWIGACQHQHPQCRVLPKAVDLPFKLLAQLTAERVTGGGII
jgi:hypothetical protein